MSQLDTYGGINDSQLLELATLIRQRLLEQSDAELIGSSSKERINQLVERYGSLLDDSSRVRVTELVEELSFGFGPLEPLLADPDIQEIMVNAHDQIWIERQGAITRVAGSFQSQRELMNTIERILAPIGRRVDEAQPLVDARLPDGSRVNVVIPPLALNGPTMTIRRFRKGGFSAEQLVENGTLPQRVAQLLQRAVADGLNIIVSGGTGSGKTTTLNALSDFIPASARIVTIEDAAELQLRQPHVVRLESRPANLEGRGGITIRDLVRNALRMRPDRIVVGEVRGGEALDMIAAMSTGHEGSLSTIHAGSPQQAISRAETLAMMADIELPHAVIKDQVRSSIDLIVQQYRTTDGRRVIGQIAEVLPLSYEQPTADIFNLRTGGILKTASQPKVAAVVEALR